MELDSAERAALSLSQFANCAFYRVNGDKTYGKPALQITESGQAACLLTDIVSDYYCAGSVALDGEKPVFLSQDGRYYYVYKIETPDRLVYVEESVPMTSLRDVMKDG